MKVYSDMANELTKSIEFAYKVLFSKKFSRKSNCKMMATRMLQFQIETIAPKVGHNISKMHAFFDTSFSGVGCAVCDAKNHEFLNMGEKTLSVSEHFCRDLTSNSLEALLYLHVHYVRFYQLVSQFLTQCDHKGNHDTEATVPAESALKVEEAVEKELLACRDFRNEPHWLDSCKFVCESFSLVNYSETFYPNLDGYIAGTKYLELKLKERNDAIAADEEKEKKAEGAKGPEGENKEGEGQEGEKKEGEQTAEKKADASSKQERILEKIKYHRDARVLEENAQTTQTGENAPATDTKAPAEGDKKTEGGEQATEAAPEDSGLVPAVTLPKTPEEQLANAKDPLVFPNLANSGKLSEFKSAFAQTGVDIYKAGKEKNYEADAVKKIQDAVQAAEAEAAKKAAEKGSGEGEVETKTSFGFLGINVDRVMIHSLIVMVSALVFGL